MRFRVACILAFACFGAGSAMAAKLDGAACDALKAERARLETDALKSDMAKGPEWAKTNLAPERLKEIEQLIGIQEGIAFRCPVPKPVPQPGNVAKAGEDTKNASGKNRDIGEGGADGDKEPAQLLKKQPASAEKPAGKDPKASKADKPVGQAAVAPPKDSASAKGEKPSATAKKSNSTGQKPSTPSQKQKAKVSDAYVPPPPAIGGGYASGEPVPSPEPDPVDPPPAATANPTLSP
jgi:hypothetical protein